MFGIFESKGIKRTLASAFALAAVALKAFPQTAAFSEIAAYLAATLGGLGIAHAGISSLQGK